MRQIIVALFIVLPSLAFGQPGISFHQSNLPFIGFNYEMKNKLRPELRVGIDNYFDDISFEGIITYDVVEKEDYEIYAGLGIRIIDFTGLVIPIGLNVYPLTTKQFGFHVELTPIISEDAILRGSWGIRYWFNKK